MIHCQVGQQEVPGLPWNYETFLENYIAPIDDEDSGVKEYQIFKETFKSLQASNLDCYNQLTSAMSADQLKEVQEIVQ